jgi:UPF0755 protein
MSKRKTMNSLSCMIISLLIVCMCAGIAGGLFVYIPIQADRVLGPASLDLSPVQHFYLSILLLLQSQDLVRPNDPAGVELSFQVKTGETPASIAERLENQGLISNSAAFRDFLVYAGLDTTLQAGDYRLSPAMTTLQIARTMQDATPSEIDFNILSGWRREEIANSILTSGLDISTEAFMDATSRPPSGYPFLQDLPTLASLEGYLLPDRYHLSRNTSIDELIALMLANFDLQVTDEMQEAFAKQGLSLHHAVTLASIIEREAMVEEEMPRIASVFLNRLSQGMKLDSDPTVQYALGYNPSQMNWWTNPLSQNNLQVDSPYNTYLYPGLPPGPIANPSLAALRAVAYPEQTPYFYFRAACDGSGRHNFSETFEEHLQYACP